MKNLIFDTKEILAELCKNQHFTYLEEESKLLMKRTKGHNVQFLFPIKIKINPITVGLIIGEGYIDNRQFVFANSNEKIIKNILEFLS